MENNSKKSIDILEPVLLREPDKDKNCSQISYVPVVSKEQISAVAAIATEIWHEHFISILTLGQIDYMVEKFQSVPAMTDQVKNQGYQYSMIMLNGTIIGYCGIREEEEEKSLFLSKLYIHKEYRGHGYASSAFQFMIDLCKKKGYQKIWLTVNRFNDNTIKVYEKKGFIKMRTQIADIGNGFVMDDYIMEKTIM